MSAPLFGKCEYILQKARLSTASMSYASVVKPIFETTSVHAFPNRENMQDGEGENPPSAIDPHDDLTRCYKVDVLPPDGFKLWIKRKFKSTIVCTLNRAFMNNTPFTSLTLSFTDRQDYIDAREFDCSLNGKKISFKCEDENPDTFIVQPALTKNLYVYDFPVKYATNKKIIRTIFEKYVEYRENDVTLVLQDGMYTGGIVIPVTSYSRVPSLILEIPMFSSDGVELVGGKTLKIRTKSTGYARDMKPEPKPEISCNYCKKTGHVISKCPELKNKRYRCNLCNSDSAGCTRKDCKNMDQILAGNFPKRTIAEKPSERRSGAQTPHPKKHVTITEDPSFSNLCPSEQSSYVQYNMKDYRNQGFGAKDLPPMMEKFKSQRRNLLESASQSKRHRGGGMTTELNF